MSISDELTRARKASGRTQQALAAAAGLSRMTVQRFEAGEVDPRVSTLQEMARALGMEWMLVPRALRPDVEAFLRSNGRILGQPAGTDAPPSVVQTLLKGQP
ncbi:Helix-turn-helix [Xylophilus ampelinus]|jgi:transcriptional regulator with XRE-family HTH domain|uniref:XRE family transcriptional regulator n=1 Tax=Variovorax paradoxus TaxID=34073 RepID=A0A2W5SH24_VARPD|nr:helix-turn-helix transcriptional regulator [Variovorax sp.]PZQ74170.1 MAG: XRE family transcriptional regulator [Variovorax paradoxus]VTY20784.1 Helix-turn-helix [Xylophilus ampelinus]